MSEEGGRTALAGFFALLALGGAASLAGVLGALTIAEWRANHEFVETTCTVVAERVAQVETEEGRIKYRPEVVFRYHAGGRDIETAGFDASGVYFTDEQASREALEKFTPGSQYPCWYDPQNPQVAVLERGYSWYAWVIPLLPAALVAIGVGGLIYLFLTWGKSSEHRSLLEQNNRDRFDTGAARPRFPYVPDEADAADSRGTVLRYRLPGVPVFSSFFLTALALAWNAATAWFVIRAIFAFFAGRLDHYVYSPLLLPFVAAGGYLAYLAGRELLSSVGLEPTVVEISNHPLRPGEQYEVYVSQAGRLTFKRLIVSLVCDEEATYRQGTNSHTHTQRVVQTELYRRESFSIEHREPLAERFQFQVPPGAMHSFQSDHNGVKWKLCVSAELQKWPDFEREFALIVHPPRRGGAS